MPELNTGGPCPGRLQVGAHICQRQPQEQDRQQKRAGEGISAWAKPGAGRGRQQAYLGELPISEPLHPPHARDSLALGCGSVGDDDCRPPGETFDLSPDELPNSKFLSILKAKESNTGEPKAQTPHFIRAPTWGMGTGRPAELLCHMCRSLQHAWTSVR